MIKNNPDTKEVLPVPPRVCFRRPKNIRDILIKAQVPPKNPEAAILRVRHGFRKCGTNRCGTCPLSVNSKNHTSFFSNKTWPIYSQTSCNTKNCIYLISCNKGAGVGLTNVGDCGKESQYIGMTTQVAKKRFTSHRSNVQPWVETKKSVIGKHFSQKGHSENNMRFLVIEEVKNKNPFVLKARESYWIQKYGNVEHPLYTEE